MILSNFACFCVAERDLFAFQVHIPVLDISNSCCTATAVQEKLHDDPIPIFTEAAICCWPLEKFFNLLVTVGFFHSVLWLKGLECYGSISLFIAPCQK